MPAPIRIAILCCAISLSACGRQPDRGVVSPPVFETLPSVAGEGAAQPRLTVGADGTVLMSWLEPEGEDYVLRFARFEDGRLGSAESIARGSDWFINWADFPSVLPVTRERWVAHWLVSLPDSFAYNVVTAISGDGGRSWSEPAVLNEDGTETEHGFVTLFPWDQDIGAVWLDGRRLDQWTFEKELAAEVPLGVSLYYARIDTDGRVLERGEIDELVCDCCQTDVAMTARGPVLVYRDRTADEIRDIVVRRHDGQRWLDIVQAGVDNFQIDGCPVNGPAVAARGDDVAVAWFTAPDNEPAVRLARSSDAGASFDAAVEIDGEGSFGQVGLVLLDDSSAVVSWWRRHPSGSGLALAARRVSPEGELGVVHIVAESQVSQPLDVPQLVQSGAGFLFAWTGIDEQAGIHTVYATGL